MSQEQNGKLAEEGTQTEVVAKAKRRQHPAEYKLRILREIDECKGSGEVGALLRREGLYSSLVSKWREQRERGSLTGLSGHRGGAQGGGECAGFVGAQRGEKKAAKK